MYSAKIDASVNNIGPAFTSGPESLILTNTPAGLKIVFDNTTTKRIVAWIGRWPDSDAPPSGTANELRIPAKTGKALDEIHIGRNSKVFIRTDDGTTAITGIVAVTIWGL